MTKFIQGIYFWTLTTIKPLIVFMGKVYPKFSSKEHIFKRYYEIEGCLKPGHILLTKSDAHFSNLVNIGEWKHVVVYIGKEKGIPMIVEAIGEGVVKRPLIEMLGSKDRLMVVEATKELIENEEQMKSYINFVKAQVGLPYDHNFDSFSKNSHAAWYCSELPYIGINQANPNSKFTLRSTYGISTVTPSDYANMAKKGEKFIEILTVTR